uniref:Uncharacterized protein n=1 Tax=Chlamydomonas leiostraca TaxID=1034604 RepID=A0A7S0RMV3_9CHLO
MRAIALVALVACIGMACAQEPEDPEPMAAFGWWSSLQATYVNPKTKIEQTTNCIVRDYPWRGSTKWTPIQCKTGQPYDHQYLWRLAQRNGSLLDRETITPGTEFDFRIFMYPFSYTTVDTNARPGKGTVRSGQLNTTRARYQVQRINPGPGEADTPINLATEQFYLLASQGGSTTPKYCYISGSGHSAVMYCDSLLVTKASKFKMAYNWMWGVSFSSVDPAVDMACGGFQIVNSDDENKWVNCTRPTIAPSNYKTSFGLGFRNPGAARLTSGMEVVVKHYDPLWRYVMNRWQTSDAFPNNMRLMPETSNDQAKMNQTPLQWFKIEKVGGVPGAALQSGDVVTIWSTRLQNYCCVGPAPENRIQCSRKTITTADARCRFRMDLNPTAKP